MCSLINDNNKPILLNTTEFNPSLIGLSKNLTPKIDANFEELFFEMPRLFPLSLSADETNFQSRLTK